MRRSSPTSAHCIIDSLHFDGIALDVEHLGSTPANTNYTNLVKAFGSYFGPLSSNSTTTTTAAAWEPSGAKKAGIMVFAGNVDSSYTNTISRAVK